MSEIEFTVTQQKIVDLLSDGRPHPADELKQCLWDTFQADIKTVRAHVYKINDKLRPKGQEIMSRYLYKKTHFQWVRLLRSPVDDGG